MGANLFLNSLEFLETLSKATLGKRIRPELEVFEVGMVYTCLRYLERGLLKPPLHFQFVLGTPNGMTATPKSLLHLSEIIPPGVNLVCDRNWSEPTPHGHDSNGDGRSCPGWIGGQYLLFEGGSGQ